MTTVREHHEHHEHRYYAATLAADVGALDGFEDALDTLPDAALIGGEGHDSAALVFTVLARTGADALAAAASLLLVANVAVPDGASLSVLAQEP